MADVEASGMALFANRVAAGRELANMLGVLAGRPDMVVLGLARGGVPVAAEVATRLNAPLGTMVVRKLGAPHQPELAIGAMGPDESVWLDRDLISRLGVSTRDVRQAIEREAAELRRRIHEYPGIHVPLSGNTVLLVDDGLATGASMRAAIASTRNARAAEIIVAVPVAAPSSIRMIEHSERVRVVAVAAPSSFQAVGYWYDDFHATSDEEVRAVFAAHVRL